MYVRLLNASLSPELLMDGVDRSLHFERLARFALNRSDGKEYLALVDGECEQIEAGDVPLFTTVGDAQSIVSSDGRLLLAFRESALTRARRRMTSLNRDERSHQLRFLQAAVAVAPPRARAATLARQRGCTHARS